MATPETPPPVRAVARVGVGPAAGGPWRLLRYRSRQRIGRFRVEQLVVVEVVLIGALALLHRPLWQIVAGGVLGLLVVVLAFLTTGGRWWLERMGLRARFRRRRAASRPGRASDQRLAALRELSPALSVETAEERDTRIGVGHDGTGWFAVAEIESQSRTGVMGDRVEPLPLGVLAKVLLDEEFPVSAVQVVTQTVPAPAPGLAPQAPCQLSYRELAGAITGPVAHQVQWVAVRLDGEDAAEAAAARGGGTQGVHRAIAAALARCSKAIRGGDRTCRTLDADELVDALVRSCGVVGAGNAPGRNRTAEEWERWRGDGLAHAGYWIRDWPAVRPEGGELLADLVAHGGAETSLSLVLRRPAVMPDPDVEQAADLQGVVRVIAEPTALGPACASFVAVAERAGFGLRLLSGEQAPAIYSSAPTGVPR
jgi:type VII secretion protein EccE